MRIHRGPAAVFSVFLQQREELRPPLPKNRMGRPAEATRTDGDWGIAMSKQRKKKPIFRIIVLLICVPVFCLSAYKVSSQLIVEHKEKGAFSELVEQVNRARSVEPEQAEVPSEDQPEEPNAEPGATPVPQILSAYAPLYAQNPDFFGWIEIEGTEINYPVMHTPEDSEYYLHRAFDRSYSFSGVPFLDGKCSLDCGNYIVYGHNMKNGTMFARIPRYSSEDYWKEHPVIRFDTLYETGTYEVIAAFYSKAYPADAVGVFRYYQYTDLRDSERFAEYMEQVKAASLYNTGIDAEYGDQLLTLSTCEYHATDGRFVVVAKKRTENPIS